jgi:uncharacterized protein YutE (UPF0331/DUF86 family)
VVDRDILAAKIAAVRDAVARIRAVLPASREAFREDRTTREVVVLNLFVAVQDCLSLATHWLADAGWEVPQNYRDVVQALSDHGVLEPELAARLASAAGLRNLVAHRYGALDLDRIYEMASSSLNDLLQFCAVLSRRASE